MLASILSKICEIEGDTWFNFEWSRFKKIGKL